MAGWAAAGFAARFRRFAGLRRSSRSSQRRMVSRPISIPISRRPPTNDSTDSPACLNCSNSERCGSNCAVAWLRGCRAWATAWARVVGRGGLSGEWVGNDIETDGAQYAWSLSRARGAPGARSKRKRLDVGVLPYSFVLFLSDESDYISSLVSDWVVGLINSLSLVRCYLGYYWRSCSAVGSFSSDSLVECSARFYLSGEQTLAARGSGC